MTLAEYPASTAGSVRLARYGRWTDLSGSPWSAPMRAPLTAAHSVGFALDLDLALITMVNTAAGAAVGFTADVPAAIRKGIATDHQQHGSRWGRDLVILVHPDNASLLQDIAPIGGVTIADGLADSPAHWSIPARRSRPDSDTSRT